MIDIHCHILPGADQGARDIQESIEMAKQAVEQGVDTIIAAPHHRNGRYDNYKIDILEQVAALKQTFQQENLPITLLAGQVTQLTSNIIESIELGHVLAVNNTSNYVLVELPETHIPQSTNQLLFDIQIHGYKPIIAHPEQNQVIIDNPNILYEFVKHGALTQLAAGSVVGKQGKKTQKLSHQLIKANLIHFIASEAYNLADQRVFTNEAIRHIERMHGKEQLVQFQEHADALVNGEIIIGDEPKKVKKKKRFGIL